MVDDNQFKELWENLSFAYGKTKGETSAMGKLCYNIVENKGFTIDTIKRAFHKLMTGESDLHREKRFFPKIPEIIQECTRCSGGEHLDHDWQDEDPNCHRCYFCSYWPDNLIRCKFKIAEQDQDTPIVFDQPQVNCKNFIHIFDYGQQFHYQTYWQQVEPNFGLLRNVMEMKVLEQKSLGG